MAFSSDWLIRYTVIRFFRRRFKILFSYSIRFHETANRTNISPVSRASNEILSGHCSLRVVGYLVSVVSFSRRIIGHVGLTRDIPIPRIIMQIL